MQRRFFASACLALTVLFAGRSAFAAEVGVTDAEIRIGVHLPLTGPASFVGQGSKVGIDAAVAEINKHGGINGRKLAIVFADDRGAPDGGVAAVRRLVEGEKVLLVFGASTSTATVSAIPYFHENGAPYFVSLAADPRVLEKFAPNIYSGATVPQADLVKVFTRFLATDLKAKRVGLMQCDQGHCISGGRMLKAGLEAAGAAVTVATFNSGETDFTGQVHQIKAAAPDVVFVYGLAPDGGRIFPQLRRAGVTAQLVGDGGVTDLAVGKLAGNAAEGYYGFWQGGKQHLDDKSGAMGKFLDSLAENKIERPANTPNQFTLMTYADTYVIAEGIRGAGKDLTRAGLLRSLDTNIRDFVPGTGPWSYAASFALPRTFTATDHQGGRMVQPVVYRAGTFKPATF